MEEEVCHTHECLETGAGHHATKGNWEAQGLQETKRGRERGREETLL